ncbi:MAG: 16S rRNA (adenine(1518)-N(6)/adenine(1519)-N(6))-dimethyltransferase RsmA [Acidilobaceae archaeon]
MRELGIRPRDRLGQHFLVDPRGVHLFLSRLPYEEALEIGPGLGSLTYYASQKLPRVVAVELDRRLCTALALSSPPNVQLVNAEGLSLLLSARLGLVFSNTPYNLSSAIVAAGARNNSVRKMLLGVQKEVAERMLAREGEEQYGRLTLLVKRYFSARLVGTMERDMFYPMPKVRGAVVELERRREWERGDETFEEVTRCLFSGRNKRAGKMVKACIGKEVELGDKRVEELTPEEVERVVQAYRDSGGGDEP